MVLEADEALHKVFATLMGFVTAIVQVSMHEHRYDAIGRGLGYQCLEAKEVSRCPLKYNHVSVIR